MCLLFGTMLISAYPDGAPNKAWESLRPGQVQGGGVPIGPQPDSTFPFNLEFKKG